MTSLEELRMRLQSGVVSFTYEKNDGTIRKAKGTLKSDMCPPIEGTGRPLGEHLQLYFDVEKNHYRSFNKSKFLGIDGEI